MTEKPNIDVLILVALKDELDSLLKVNSHAVSDCTWTKVTYKDTPYWRRDFLHEGNSKFTVACARTTEMGTPAISALGAVLIDQLNPRYLAMCGICAGREDKTNMGDIIVGSSVFNYEKGKVLRRFDGDKNIKTETRRETKTFNLDDPILRMIQDFDERPCFLEEIQETKLKLTSKALSQAKKEKNNSLGDLPADEIIKIMIGSIATVNKVVEDLKKGDKALIFEEIEAIQRNVLAIDMEASAIGDLAHHERIPWIVAKGVQDHADNQKNDHYRLFAAHASARFLIEFFYRYLNFESEKNQFADFEEGLPENHNIPLQRPASTELVFRDELINSITNNFITAHQDDFSRFGVLALSGIPGVGKTTVALEIAYRLGRRYPAGVFWIDARDLNNLRNGIELILKKLNIYNSENSTENQDANFLFSRYLEKYPCLIFFDALDSSDTAINLIGFLPKTGLSRVIITTKNSKIELQSSLEIIELKVLNEISAIEVLTRFQTLPLTKKQEEIAASICAELGYLPLALNLAARYLKNKSMALSVYLDKLRECGVKWQGLESKNHIKRSIYITLSLCIEGLSKNEENGDLALKILHRCTAINLVGDIPSREDEESLYWRIFGEKEKKVPTGLLAAIKFSGFNQKNKNYTLDQFSNAIEMLEVSGLVRVNPDTGFLWIHKLTFMYLNILLDKEDFEYLAWRSIITWSSIRESLSIVGWIDYSGTILSYFAAIPKIEKISRNSAVLILETLYNMADFSGSLKTEEIVDKAISIARSNSDKNLELILRIDKAYALYKLGKLEESESLYKQLFFDCRKKPINIIKEIDFLYYYGCLILDLEKIKDKKFTPYLGEKTTHRDFALYLWDNGIRSIMECLDSFKNKNEDSQYLIFLMERGLYRFFYQKKTIFPEALFSASENELEHKIQNKFKPILSDLTNWDNQYILSRGPLRMMLSLRFAVKDCN